VGVATTSSLHLLAQLNLSDAFSAVGGVRFITGFTMLVHMFWAELFVGFALAAPVLQAWGARTGSPRMDRLAHSMARFNVLTFSTGATFAVLFLVLLVGLYPSVTASIFTHFFYAVAIAMLSMVLTLWGMYSYYYKWDRYSVLNKKRHIALGFTMESFGTAIQGIFNPMFTELVLHRTFANLSWPAFAVAAWASFMYVRSKTSEDRAFYDWSSSVGLTWGVGFLMLQPLVGFTIVYALKLSRPENPVSGADAGGAYERLTSGATSNLLLINLILVVVLIVLSNAAMYFGAERHPDRAGRVPIRFFGLVAAVAGLYAVSPLAEFPFLYMRYIALLVMVLATFGAFATYLRGRLRFRYGSPGRNYRLVLMATGVVAAVIALNMGFMKSNSRVPYTVYNQPGYTVQPSPPPTGFGR
jgi:cytochrome bd ubiquinol oxidase subunit I